VTSTTLQRPIAGAAPVAVRRPAGAAGRTAALVLAVHVVAGIPATVTGLPITALGAAAILGGLWFAVSDARPTRAVLFGVYVAASDVLWRMSGAQLPWEGGKIIATMIFAIVIVRFVKVPSWPAITFLVLLLPAAVITVFAEGLGGAREDISFSLSGPILLGIAAWLFSRMVLDPADTRAVLVAGICPALTAGVIAAASTFGGNVDFGSQSNAASSGGYGPNQVSTVLGLGALLCLLLAVREQRIGPRLAAIAGALLLLSQAALTFSRGGVLNAGVAVGVALVFALRDGRFAMRVLAVLAIVAVIAVGVWQQLDAFTGGAISARFSETSTTGRSEIAEGDIEVFFEHPMFGVGVGQIAEYRDVGHFSEALAHTEYTRVLGEHGALGVAALVVILGAAGIRVLRATSTWETIWSASLVTWSCAAMLNAAMRTSTIALAFGLAMASFRSADDHAHAAPSSPSTGPR
jgi:O-antigen ligase